MSDGIQKTLSDLSYQAALDGVITLNLANNKTMILVRYENVPALCNQLNQQWYNMEKIMRTVEYRTLPGCFIAQKNQCIGVKCKSDRKGICKQCQFQEPHMIIWGE